MNNNFRRVLPTSLLSVQRLSALAILAGALTALPPSGSTPAQAAAGDNANDTTLSGAYLSGRHAQFRRDPSKASDYFLSVLERDPKNPDLLRRAFLLLTSSGRAKEGFALAERLLAETQKNADLAKLALSIRDAEDGKFDDAVERLSSLPAAGLNLFALPLIRAWLFMGQNNIDEALSALESNLSNEGVAVLYGAHLGLINDLAGNTDKAAARYDEAAKKRDTPNLRLTILAGSFYERTGRKDDAKALYDRYMAANPDSPMLEGAYKRLTSGGTPPRPVANALDGLAEALFSLAGALRQQDSIGTSLFTRLALEVKPNFPMAKILVAEILESNLRREQAIEVYGSVEKGTPYSWTARLRIASNLDSLERTDEAVRTLKAMAEERKDRYDSLVSLGDIMRRRERYKEAADAYTLAKERIPEIAKRHWPVLYASGIAHERLKKWDQAEKDFLKALELEPNQPFVLNYLGYSWVELGKNLDRARGMIEQAVARRPRDGYIVDSLGWVLYQLGDIKGAVKNMERAVELRPEDPVINDHLGDVLWQAGRKIEARFQWRRALSLEPEKDLIPKIEKKIKEGIPPLKPKK